MAEMGIVQGDKCALCQGVEDHSHRLKKCLFPDIPFQLIREMFSRYKIGKKGVEPLRMCLKVPLASLCTVQCSRSYALVGDLRGMASHM